MCYTKWIEEISNLFNATGDDFDVLPVGPVLLGLFLKGVFSRHGLPALFVFENCQVP